MDSLHLVLLPLYSPSFLVLTENIDSFFIDFYQSWFSKLCSLSSVTHY